MEYFVEPALLQGLEFNSNTSVVSRIRHASELDSEQAFNAALSPLKAAPGRAAPVRAQRRSQKCLMVPASRLLARQLSI